MIASVRSSTFTASWEIISSVREGRLISPTFCLMLVYFSVMRLESLVSLVRTLPFCAACDREGCGLLACIGAGKGDRRVSFDSSSLVTPFAPPHRGRGRGFLFRGLRQKRKAVGKDGSPKAPKSPRKGEILLAGGVFLRSVMPSPCHCRWLSVSP